MNPKYATKAAHYPPGGGTLISESDLMRDVPPGMHDGSLVGRLQAVLARVNGCVARAETLADCVLEPEPPPDVLGDAEPAASPRNLAELVALIEAGIGVTEDQLIKLVNAVRG